MAVSVTNNFKLSFRNDITGVSTTSTTTVTSGVWHELQTRILVNGAAGESEIWLDGVRIDSLSIPQDFGQSLVGHRAS
jgi:hypothetical protein